MKVNISTDFEKYPRLFTTPEDIERHIATYDLDLPVLNNLLKMRKEKRLDLTPTEVEFYFQSMFHYIYDVFRVPVPETFDKLNGWLNYIEINLTCNGLRWAIDDAYDSTRVGYDSWARFYKMRVSFIKNYHPEVINCYQEIDCDHGEKDNKDVIEAFWIRSDRTSGQPFDAGDEAYMRVWVFPKRVYIFGCDDCSFTLTTDNEEESKTFAMYLKCAAPVWNFSNLKYIHHELEFTN